MRTVLRFVARRHAPTGAVPCRPIHVDDYVSLFAAATTRPASRFFIDEAARIGHFENGVKAGFFDPKQRLGSQSACRTPDHPTPRPTLLQEPRMDADKRRWHKDLGHLRGLS